MGFLGDAEAMSAVATWAIAASGAEPLVERLDDGVEVCRRVGPGREVLIVINHTAQPRTCRLRAAMRDVLADSPAGPDLALPPRQVLVLT